MKATVDGSALPDGVTRRPGELRELAVVLDPAELANGGHLIGVDRR